MYALPTNRRMKVMRFVHTAPRREISGMESVGREEDMQKTATHIVPLEILDDAPRTLLRPSKPLLFLPFSRDVFYERLAFSRRFVLPSTPNGATRKRLYHDREIFRQTSPSATREPARNFAVYGELINAVCADEKCCLRSSFENFSVGLKICGLNAVRFARVNIGRASVMRLHPQLRPEGK